MKTSRLRSTLLAATSALALACASAHADPLIDTFLPGDQSGSTTGVGWNFNFDQRLGVAFSVDSTTTITDFLVAMGGAGTFTMGVQGGVTTAQGFVPSSSYLFDVVVNDPALTDPARRFSQGGLGWTVAPGDYFFVIEGDFPSGGGWGVGTGGETVISVNHGPWGRAGPPAMALRINGSDGVVAAIPEPSTYAMFVFGGALLMVIRRRRAESAQRRG